MNQSFDGADNLRPEDIGEQLAKRARQITTPDDAKQAADRAQQRMDKLERHIPNPLRMLWSDIKLLIGFVRDSTRGKYRHAPWRSVVVAAGALLYFVSPIDLIPDFIPVIGFLDDAAVIALAVKLIHDDLQTYAAWRDGPPARIVEMHDAGGSSQVNLFLHGYKAIKSEQDLQGIRDAIMACNLPGRSALLLWKSGDWSLSRVFATPAIVNPLNTAARWTLSEFSDFQLAQVRADNLGRRLGTILDGYSQFADASINLIGHSLGSYILHHALAFADLDGYQINDCFCIAGVARTDRPDWRPCLEKIHGKLYNFYNPSDRIAALPELWSGKRIGRRPLPDMGEKVVNIQHDFEHCDCWRGMPALLQMAMQSTVNRQ